MLSSLELVKRELRQKKTRGATVDADDEQYVLDAIDDIVGSLQEDIIVNRQFAPTLETRYFDLKTVSKGGQIDGSLLYLADDLLSLTSLTNDEETVAEDDRLLLPRGDVSINRIKLLNNEAWTLAATDPEDGIAVTGEWGYHHRPSQRWKASGSTLQATVNASTTSITVDNADGVGWRGDAPRFSLGQLIKLDDEWMSVRAVTLGEDANPDTLTVVRAMQGTIGAAHSSTAVVYIWNPIAEAERFVTRAVLLEYKRRGEFITTQVEGVTEVVFPTRHTMPEYKRLLAIPRRLAMKVRTV